jgi:hypothetical protein
MARIQSLFSDVKREIILDKEILFSSECRGYRNLFPSWYLQELLQISFAFYSTIQTNHGSYIHQYLEFLKLEIYNSLEIEMLTEQSRNDVIAFAYHSKNENVQIVVGLYTTIVEWLLPYIQNNASIQQQYENAITNVFRETKDYRKQIQELKNILSQIFNQTPATFVLPSHDEIRIILRGEWNDSIGKKIASVLKYRPLHTGDTPKIIGV